MAFSAAFAHRAQQAQIAQPSHRSAGGMLGNFPERVKFGPFKGPKDTLRSMERLTLGPRGEQSHVVRQFTEWATQDVFPKDYLGEIIAIRNVFLARMPVPGAKPDAKGRVPTRPLFRYMNDPRHVEWIKDPQRQVEEIHQSGVTTVDCLPEGTLLLRDDFALVPIEEIEAGDRIWGLDRWTTVEATAYKGVLDVDVLLLNNGSQVKATGDHKFVVADCRRHPRVVSEEEAAHRVGSKRKGQTIGKPCSCRMEERQLTEIRVSELEVGMSLAWPERLPFGSAEMDVDRAHVEGLYVADGWCHSANTSFHISGRDGCPKEAQKRAVKEICERLGVATTWHRKSIHVRDKEWALRMHRMGLRAPEKHLLSLNLGEAAAAATLQGVMADSGQHTKGPGRTFTSRRLAIQTRVLHKMFGIGCGIAFIEDHGGLGRNPIWRIGQRKTRKAPPRVKRIDRAVFEAPCFDLQTDSGHVYLPEHDVTVHNCDEIAVTVATMALQLGREVEFVALGFAPKQLTHVAARIKEPKSNTWIFVDPVAGPREREAAQTAKEILTWSLD